MNTNISLPRLWLRLLTFRARYEDFESLGHRHLFAGLVACWIVGMGRYWDDSRATALQHTGVGSVIYVFGLSALLWVIVKPMSPTHFSYLGILTFVTMTSPPAALYAIPVEKWMSLEDANLTNLRFLEVVALWRLSLWIWYMRRWGQFTAWMMCVGAAMPLAIILLTLMELNLHHVVFNIMGGIREADQSSQDAAYEALWVMGLLATPVSFLAGIGWLILVLQKWSERRVSTDLPP